MWDSWKAPHREQVSAAVGLLNVGTVYELGCGSGPNLRLLRERYPKMFLAGCEPNPGFREHARQHFPVDDFMLPEVPQKSFDLVFTCYALAYIDREAALITLTRVHGHGTQYMILIEPSAYVTPFGPPGLYEGHAMPSFVHDYSRLAEQAGWKVEWRWPIVPPHQGLNATLVLSR